MKYVFYNPMQPPYGASAADAPKYACISVGGEARAYIIALPGSREKKEAAV